MTNRREQGWEGEGVHGDKLRRQEKQRGANNVFSSSKVHHHLLENVLLPERILQ